MIFLIEDFFYFLCFQHKTIGFIFLAKAKPSPLGLIKNCVCVVHVHNLVINWRSAWKHKRTSEKACMLKKLLFVLLFNKYYVKPNIIKTCRIGFCIKTLPTMMLSVLEFFGLKRIFWLIRHQVSPKPAQSATCWNT